MAKNKTAPTQVSVHDFIAGVEDETKRDDSYRLIELCQELTRTEATMWGPSIVGFGTYHYKYESGHEGDMPVAAFSPRKNALVIYLNTQFEKKEEYLAKLGKHKASKGCIYIKKLADINFDVLKKMMVASIKSVKKR